MPEKGWSVLTVREATALKIRGLAKAQGLTADEAINQILTSSSGPKLFSTGQWSVCETCGSKVKTKNMQDHMDKVHPAELTVKARP